MKKWIWVGIVLLLVGCQSTAQTVTPIANQAVTASATASPTRVPTATSDPSPTYTALPSNNECPKINTELVFDFPDISDPRNFEEIYTEFLNAGGDPHQLTDVGAEIKDLTNDGILEVILWDGPSSATLLIFMCSNGEYEESTTRPNESYNFVYSILGIEDNNQNGYIEIIVFYPGCMGFRCGSIDIVEWDGKNFAHLITDTIGYDGSAVNFASINDPSEPPYLEDLDNDGILELIWKGGFPPAFRSDFWTFYPSRMETHIYKWDGKSYHALPISYPPPIYRYEAVQDGDRFTMAGDYKLALHSYQLVIEDEQLDWWTVKRGLYIYCHQTDLCAEDLISGLPPIEDVNERPILGAYATFRSMLVQLLQNDETAAEWTYHKAGWNYPPGNPGHVITGMADVFWSEYQSTKSIPAACEKAVAYMDEHQEILTYLTGSTNSLQSIQYEPFDTCPFK
jgi:hypothetical protein